MIKKLALSLAAVAAIVTSASADTGIFGGYIILDINGTGDQFFKLENPNDTTTQTFHTRDLGDFDPAVNSLFFSGGEAQTFKSGTGDVTGSTFYYRVYPVGAPSGSFVAVQLPFFENLSNGDQKWQSLAPNDNLLNNLAPGDYAIQTYIGADTNEGTKFLNNGGADYIATFTVVPEPSSLSLLAGPAILGAWFFVRRRRA